MPCESCDVQFTVFRRKHACAECRRLYCTQCLLKLRNGLSLCERCRVFTSRPLTRPKLLALKPKDLIYFLQSKHISTTGCIEKEELVDLVLTYANQSDNGPSVYDSPRPGADCSTFDQLKQTCQNLFTTITDKMDLNFDKRSTSSRSPPSTPAATPTGRSPTANASAGSVFTQPPRRRPSGSTASSSFQSPAASAPVSPSGDPTANASRGRKRSQSSRCRCSPDDAAGSTPPDDAVPDDDESDAVIRHYRRLCAESSAESGPLLASDDHRSDSDLSSFEEIARPLTGDRPTPSGSPVARRSAASRQSGSSPFEVIDASPSVGPPTEPEPAAEARTAPAADEAPAAPCARCGKRRLNVRNVLERFRGQLQSESVAEPALSAELDRFLAYLLHVPTDERSPAESDTNRDYRANLVRLLSADDDVTADGDAGRPDAPAEASGGSAQPRRTADEDEAFGFGQDDGIHVYGSDAPTAARSDAVGPKQFFNLTDIKDRSELVDLSVKQLKEILMLNRIDFKGCCEKNELLDRVTRLWNERKACPDVDELASDDLCKICMDAPIECVMLECGHMATCTECGKVLNECPICRQYVVRVVRFFRA